LLSELAKWGDAMRSQVNDLSTQLRTTREEAARNAAAARRAFVQELRDEVSAMRSSFRASRSSGAPASPPPRSATRREETQPEQAADRGDEAHKRSWTGTARTGTGKPNDVIRALRERSRAGNF
jgi:hypothetical protein